MRTRSCHGRGPALLVLLAVLAAAGCATPDPRPPPRVSVTIPPAPPASPVPPPPPSVVYVQTLDPVDVAARHLLAYHDRLWRMAAAELGAEVARLGDGSSSVRLAMELASALGSTRGPGDLARAIALLEQVQRDRSQEAEAWHPFARLLAARYLEQRRIEEQLEKTSQQLRDTQRDTQRRMEQLNEKLEALRAIERSLSGRQAPAAPGQPAGKGAP